MTTIANISSVAYRKGSWMRYTLWGVGVLIIVVLAVLFVRTVNGEVAATVPDGWRFAVAENYAEGVNLRTVYYVYDDHILVEDISYVGEEKNRSMMIYDGINTTSLQLDGSDTTEICELGSCNAQPKVLATIKSLLSRKIGREYVGL